MRVSMTDPIGAFAGRPHGKPRFSSVGKVLYLVTTTPDGNSALHQHKHPLGVSAAVTTDLLGRPIGDAVADPAAGPRIYVTTEYDGSTIVNAVDPSGRNKTVTIDGTALGAIQLAVLEGQGEDGYLYQNVATGSGGRTLVIIDRATHAVGRTISTNAPAGPAIFRDGNVYLLSSVGDPATDGTSLVWFNPHSFVAGGTMSFTDLQFGVPQISSGSGTPTLVTRADGTYYLTLLRYDPGTDRYTTNVVRYGDHLLDVRSIPGKHTGPPQRLSDGTIIQVVHADGITRYVILDGNRI